VMPGTGTVLQDRSNDRSIVMQQMIRAIHVSALQAQSKGNGFDVQYA